MNKRSRDEAYDVDDQLRKFKNIIRDKSNTIIEKELGKIVSRSLHGENISMYLKSQYDLDKTNGDILRAIIGAVQHVPASTLFDDIKSLSSRLWEQLRTQENNRFYIVLTGGSVHKNKRSGTPCTHKSNMFLSILALCYNKDLLDHFEDFCCEDTPLHSKVLSENVTNFVYIDDASFSGTQMSSSTMSLGMALESDRKFTAGLRSSYKMHLMVLYMSQNAINNTPINDFPGQVYWYYTKTKPVDLEDALLDLKLSIGDDIGDDKIQSVAEAFTRGSRGVSGEMDKPLFYTDLKIPDSVSIYPMFLLSPVLVDSELKTQDFPRPIVKNCELPVDGDEARSTGDLFQIDNGTFCPVSTYKEPDWKRWLSELFPLFS